MNSDENLINSLRQLGSFEGGRWLETGEEILFNNCGDEFVPVGLAIVLALVIPVGLIPIILIQNGWYVSLVIWITAPILLTVAMLIGTARTPRTVQIKNEGIRLRFRNGGYRDIEWENIESVDLKNDIFLQLAFLWFPLLISDIRKNVERGILRLNDSSKYYLNREIIEIIRREQYGV